MDLCQESETHLENNENNEIQSTEETELTFICPDGKSEKNHVCSLLNISDITLEDDERATELVMGTGWEEAVRGWGKISPTACMWPRKKLKKARVGESANSNCLFCLSLAQGSLEASLPTETGKLEAGAVAEGGLEKNRSSTLQTQGPYQGPNTASREVNKMCFPHYIHGEKKSLQIKEFLWCVEDWAPEINGGKAAGSLSGGANRGLSISDSLTSKALLVLPPLKPSPSSSLDVLGTKNKSVTWQMEDKMPSVEKDECVACAHALETVDGKGKKRPLELAKLKVHTTPAFPAVRTAPLADIEQCYLRWPFLPKKSLLYPSRLSPVHYLATLQLLQKQEVQRHKAKFRAKELRPPRNTRKYDLTEATQENRPRMLETKMFSRPLLPSLTVSRVVIPISTHRFL
ncbi:hypothetical protein SUZIE_120245 [Sciurus carolinensis]|uniref:Uncharacterized protein n=2 Tax=Sciurus carolinensis TaxID=30640 RepID=A0AA41MIZ7_SCICA|nr:uncharacterized protein C16orf46 homolog isoform X1 [Sciurus carolinensis]MBZ3872899.1 hypothetical protein [Sciurus carolinensis]